MDNAWFVGYSPKLSTAVWVGYPQGNIPMGPTASAARSPHRSGRQFMRAASAGYCGDFPQPTDPFVGTAFTGPHSSAKEPPPPKTLPGQTGPGAYNNTTLYAQPGKNGTPTTTTETGGATLPPATNSPGTGTGTGGGGHGHHHHG